jgi:nucleotide-binding universal stress UspA family protein
MEPAHRQAPIIAAFEPGLAASGPVEFGIAAHDVTGAPLVIVSVCSGAEPSALEELRADLAKRGVDAQVRVVDDRSPADGIARVMHELEPELVVVGATRRNGPGVALVGTTAERVMHAGRCPIVVVPKGYARPPAGVRTIGAAFSPTPEGRAALDTAVSLARTGGVALRALTVVDPGDVGDGVQGLMAEQHREVAPERADDVREGLTDADALRAAVHESAPDLEVELDVLAQDPADGLVAATRHVDLLVMGSRRYGPRRATLLGSVSRKVAGATACPVMIVPRGSEDATETLLADAASHRPD